MSVIIRLQNLPWSANALDIRQFFGGLSIPEGGVHIVGGEQGDAFIAFSTDEDARQAFNLNGGKLKEIQIKLMLSSRTEMQKVIEAARNPLAAFMPAAPAPLPAIIPPALPAMVPEIKKADSKDKDKRDRRRSRSRSRDRKERSRDRDRRDRRRRDRSRSRSRDRRDRRRRDRSHSKDRRSKDRDRRSKDRRPSEDKAGSSSNSSAGNVQKETAKVGVWEDPVQNVPSPAIQQAQALLNSFLPANLEEARRNLSAIAPVALTMGNRNGFQQNQNEGFLPNRNRDAWSGVGGGPAASTTNGPMRPTDPRHEFSAIRFGRNIQDPRTVENKYSLVRGNVGGNKLFENNQNQRMGFNRPTKPEGRVSRFDPLTSDRQGLLDRPPLLNRPTVVDRSKEDYVKDSCVQLRPYYGGYGEVRRFFQGIFIHNTGIKFINDDIGKRTGIVYIRFATSDGKENALERDGAQLKGQTVEVKHLDDDVFDNTVDRYHPEFTKEQTSPDVPFRSKSNSANVYPNKPPSKFTCLAIENLPLHTTEQDMLKIFSDYPLLSILLMNKQRHITAYIKFNNPENAKEAETAKSKQSFDGQLLNIRPCCDKEFAMVSHEDDPDDEPDDEPEDEPNGEPDDAMEVGDGKAKRYVHSECISLTGLPLKTTDRDITDFFSDVALVPTKIHLINSNLGFTGVAYCEFSSMNEASVALKKNGLPLGSGIITVTSVRRSEIESKAGIASSNSMNMPRMHNHHRPPFFPRFGHGGILGPRIMGLMGHRPLMRRFLRPPGRDFGDMAPPGCTLRMENVPYKATLPEIFDFFEGYDLKGDSVLRRYNENGTPSGEAKVVFKSSEDAFQAMQDLHMAKIRDRTVYLSQS